MKDPGRDDLVQLAEAAGLQVRWQDAHGKPRTVGPDTLRAVLQALDIPCATDMQCRDSLEALRRESEPRRAATPSRGRRDLSIVRVGASVVLQRHGSPHYRLRLEDGTSILGTARDLGNGFVAIPGIQKPGYHLLDMGGVQCTLAVVPARCPPVPALLARGGSVEGTARALRPWVLSAQVYGLNRGFEASEAETGRGLVLPGWEVGGDFSLVGHLAVEAARQGASGLAISPVHAMFASRPEHYSPYSPSSRLMLNVMYADPAAIFPSELLGPCLETGERMTLDQRGCVDWPAIQAVRLNQMRSLFEKFETDPTESLQQDFESFRRDGGDAVFHHAAYETLHGRFSATLGPGHGWRDWPAEFYDPNGEAVRRFVSEHDKEFRFHVFLQWLATRSLGKAHEMAMEHLPLGLIADMAVGTDPGGSHAWSRQDQIMTAMSVGAPPDLFQPRGQNWGLTAFSPHALQQNGYEGFIETLRAALNYAGGIRVDHVMGLARMWLVPDGADAREGVYLSYPREELLDLLTLESWRYGAVVVGENLGTVPGDFNDALRQRGMLGMSVLWFEQEHAQPPAFKAPEAWPEDTMAMASTHDLPTLRGWWAGRDIAWRVRQGEYDEAEAAAQRERRDAEKHALWRALQNSGLVRSDMSIPHDTPAAHILSFLARTRSMLLSVALEDLLGHEDQANLPGASEAGPEDRHPNWLRAYGPPVGQLLQGSIPQGLLAVLKRDVAASPLHVAHDIGDRETPGGSQ